MLFFLGRNKLEVPFRQRLKQVWVYNRGDRELYSCKSEYKRGKLEDIGSCMGTENARRCLSNAEH